MTSHKFDPEFTPFLPLSTNNGCFTYTFIPSVTSGDPPPLSWWNHVWIFTSDSSGDLKSNPLKSRLFEDLISNGPVSKWSSFYSYSNGPHHLKTGPFKIWTFLSRFQMVFEKMVIIWPDLKSRSKSRPFASWPRFDDSKSGLVYISNTHCIINSQKDK